MLAAMVVAAALMPGPSGFPRYRLSVEAILAVAAAAGFTKRLFAAEPAEKKS